MAIVAAAAIRRDVFAMMLTGLVALAAMDITHRGYPQRCQGRRRRPGELRRKAGPSGRTGLGCLSFDRVRSRVVIEAFGTISATGSSVPRERTRLLCGLA